MRSNLEYGFTIKLESNDDYVLKFLDIPSIIIKEKNRDAIYAKALNALDDYLYSLLKEGKKIPLPKVDAPKDKRIAPSEAIMTAISYCVV